MGGFVYNPPAPPDSTAPPAAADAAPAGPLDFGQALQGAVKGVDWGKLLSDLGPALNSRTIDQHAIKKAFDDANLSPAVKKIVKLFEGQIEEMGDLLVDLAVLILEPIRAVFAHLSANYVQIFAGEMDGGRPEKVPDPKTATIGTTAAGAFDSICAPLGFMGGGNPEEQGAGHAAVQKVLGTLISLHLNTWVVNVVSNLTGLGVLHFINSFDDVILSAMNTRSMGRLAFRPYMNTYMVDPLTRDLNVAHPLKDTGPGTLVRALNSGQLTNQQFLDKMREKGYDGSLASQYVIETIKHPSLDIMAWMANIGLWTDDAAIQEMQNDGYPAIFCQPILQHAKHQQADRIIQRIVDECLSEVADHVMTEETAQRIMNALGLPHFEVDLYTQLMELVLNRPRKLTYGQIKALYLESLIDLDRVSQWLEAEQYTNDDARALVLLDFGVGEKRSAHEAQLGAMYRVRSVTYAEDAAKAQAKADARKAAADQALSDKYAALAAKYGG